MPCIIVETDLKPESFPAPDYKPSEHAFIEMIHTAYSFHQSPTITPDDVWLTILQYLSKNVNNHIEHYRQVFGLGDEKEIITIHRNSYNLDDPEFVEDIFNEFVAKMNVASGKMSDLLCDFSTSTTLTKLSSQVSISSMMKEFYGSILVRGCGFPAINIEGDVTDWKKIQNKLNIFYKISHPSIAGYIKKCQGVITKFINTYSHWIFSPWDDWKKFYYVVRCGSGHEEYRGFILDLLDVEHNRAWNPKLLPSMEQYYNFMINTNEGEKELIISTAPKFDREAVKLIYNYEIK